MSGSRAEYYKQWRAKNADRVLKNRPTPEQQKAWRAANPEKVRESNARHHAKRKDDPDYQNAMRKRAKAHRAKLVKDSPATILLYAARNRARKSGAAFSITEADVVVPLVCPLLGVWMVRNGPYAPSIDKIKPELGYVPGNVWVISRKANLMKNDATVSEIEAFSRNALKLLASGTLPAR